MPPGHRAYDVYPLDSQLFQPLHGFLKLFPFVVAPYRCENNPIGQLFRDSRENKIIDIAATRSGVAIEEWGAGAGCQVGNFMVCRELFF